MIKKKLSITLINIISVFILFSCSAAFGQTHSIKMNLNQGDTFKYDTKMNMTISTQMMDMNMDMDINCLFKVLPQNNYSKELEMTYTKMNISTLMNNDTSLSAKSDSILKEFNRRIINKPVILKLSEDNQVTEVIGFDSLMINAEKNEMAQQTIKKMFSKEQFNSMFGLIFSMYPKNPVKIGDSWKVSPTFNINGIDMTMNFTYTLVEIKDGFANISLNAVISSKGEMQTGGMSIPVDMNGTETGIISINRTDGYMHNATYKMSIDATMETAGQKIPMKMSGEYSLTGN